MKEGQVKQDFNLDWKRHDEFFTSLNEKLDEISLVGENCYRDLNNVYQYFSKVKNLFNKHKGYFQDSSEFKKKLDRIERSLYDKSFLRDLKDKRPGAKNHQSLLFKRLQDIFSDMAEEFTIPELIPKPVKKEKEPWHDEKDLRKKEMMKVFMTMYEEI